MRVSGRGALVDAAEHRNEPVLILRHGKAAAAIVPVDVVTRKLASKRHFSSLERRVARGIRGGCARKHDQIQQSAIFGIEVASALVRVGESE